MSSAAASQIVVVLGAGPGLGQGICRAFAKQGHPVALLSRSLERLSELSKEINNEVNDEKRTRPYAVDITKRSDVERAFAEIKKDWSSSARIHSAICNVGGLFAMKSFLEWKEEDFRDTFERQIIGNFVFSQTFLNVIREQKEFSAWQSDASIQEAAGNLIFSGATASLRGGARVATMASGSFALRAMAQSIAREFGPQGIHVGHFILDGLIDTPRTKGMLSGDFEKGTRLEPEDIAQEYVNFVRQRRSAWSFEIDLRPAKEKW